MATKILLIASQSAATLFLPDGRFMLAPYPLKAFLRANLEDVQVDVKNLFFIANHHFISSEHFRLQSLEEPNKLHKWFPRATWQSSKPGDAAIDGTRFDLTDVYGLASDAPVQNIRALVTEIVEGDYDLVGFSTYIWNVKIVQTIVEQLRTKLEAVPAKKRCAIVQGGPEVTVQSIARWPHSMGDYFVIGAGEIPFSNLVRQVGVRGRGARLLTPPPGVAMWQGTTLTYIRNTEVIKDLDKIPSPFLEGDVSDALLQDAGAAIETQRGCSFRCTYCVYHKDLPDVDVYSMERVKSELDHIFIRGNARGLRFVDATFNADLGRAKEIVKHLIDVKSRREAAGQPPIHTIMFECNSIRWDEELFELFAKLKYKDRISNFDDCYAANKAVLDLSSANKDYCAYLGIGLQSLNQKSVKAIKRPFLSERRINEFIALAKNYNLILRMDVIMNLPYETFDSYMKAVDFWCNAVRDTDSILSPYWLHVLPDSDLEAQVETLGLKYDPDKDNAMVYETPDFSHADLCRASKITAMMARLLNSEHRGTFFRCVDETGLRPLELIQLARDAVFADEQLASSQFVTKDYLTEMYWFGSLYSDLPKAWLDQFFAGVLAKGRVPRAPSASVPLAPSPAPLSLRVIQ